MAPWNQKRRDKIKRRAAKLECWLSQVLPRLWQLYYNYLQYSIV